MPIGVYPRSKEHLSNMRLAALQLWKQPKFIAARKLAAKKQMVEQLQKPRYRRFLRSMNRKANQVRWSEPGSRERQAKVFSLVVRKAWRNPAKAAKMAANHKLVLSPSKPQISLLKRICRRGISGFRLDHPFGPYFLDVASPRRKLDIEVDEPYWHIPKRDRKRDKFLRSRGWRVIRISTSKEQATRLLRCLFC